MRARLASGEQEPANASACEPESVREGDNRRGKAAADPLLRAGNKGCWFEGGRFSGLRPQNLSPLLGPARKPRQREGRIIILMVQLWTPQKVAQIPPISHVDDLVQG